MGRLIVLGILAAAAEAAVVGDSRAAAFLAPGEDVLLALGRDAAPTPAAPASPTPAAPKAVQSVQLRHVVYTADGTVFGSMFRSLQSLILHMATPEEYVIHLIVPKKDLQKAAALKTCLFQGPQVVIHQEQPASINVNYRDRLDLKGHSSAFARLFIAEYFPDVDRAVYLDADTLVLGDVAPLFAMPMNSSLAAVEQGDTFQEVWGKWYPRLAAQLSDPQRKIFNDGVLLLDLARWRAENVTADLEDLATNAGASVDDQLLLNLEFQTKHNYDVLDQGWNDYRVRAVGWPSNGWADELSPEDGLSSAKIIHWTGAKPWNLGQKAHWFELYRHLWEAPGVATSAKCDFA